MQGYNCIMVYNSDGNRLLFCKRTKDPYKGLYNLVGGKIDNNEEAHPLEWLSIDENFFDLDRFAGEGNIGHMVEQVRGYGMGEEPI